MSLRVGLIGAGGVGHKRAVAVARDARSQLALVCDLDESRAVALATQYGARSTSDWEAAADAGDLDLIIVSTTHDMLSPVSVRALQAGKHVLCEKPMGRTAHEARQATEAASNSGRILHAGYNHRFHPAILAAHEAATTGELGDLILMRGRYGHGGRPGYDREWRADATVAGGGELLDQGAHLIDLALWFLGDIESVNGRTQTAFWDMAPVEDNAFATLNTSSGQTASFHVSWTQWKNLFSLELFGRDGYALVNGLGGSYGQESLILGRRRAQGGVPHEKTSVFDGPDRSWGAEWDAFLRAVEGDETIAAAGNDGLRTLECIGALYRSAASNGAPEAVSG
ncbi:MAG: Gfo/Idh/MocA family oxidoreductase [Gemmatimonadetes bacterium]|jgi:predicted dehydrogenase|nr:Gfo/Idh/MocA family oxidoreductase [Gemmatimonadota bacterium]MBT6148877.1 Gfo/Idh/MocA family oxidoreductase [Gemmatimonadota bacterium]MBT7864470.1 Gfo/Idh/MocA family oxidoreductase [Gemmatimonadota bacterium]